MKNPKLIVKPFAKNGQKNVIPENYETSMESNQATWDQGFGQITMLPVAAGGLPPKGQDFNGIFNQISENIVYLSQGGRFKFSAEYAEAIGGYPKGAVLQSDDEKKEYLSLIDNNKVDFNTATDISASWKLVNTDDLLSQIASKQPKGDYATKTEVGLKLDKNSVVQSTGTSTANVMSQKAVTDLSETKFDKAGGTITGSTIISRSWEALKISATAPGAAHFIRLADTGGNTASLGFLSDNSNNLSLNNEKTSTMFHVADGEIRVNSKRCLTTDDLSAAVPVGGSVIWNSSSPIPANFWKHDGRSFSASEYPEAAKVFTDLKVPKDGGYFLRIADDGAGVDPGRQVGTYQEDAARKLEGKIALRSVGNAGETLYFPTGAFNTAKPAGINARAMSPMNDDINNGGMDLLIDSSRVWPTASEFRPKNVSKYLIVRMK
ncbi:hypothetical protein ACVZH2_02880 [Morganella morganii]|uniref:hypothetical protein n=1 Tax=Morganella morganii TaxID=582 RepID=UPI0025B470BF|nr:hypothetical protein [Morganella morganii]MDN3813708.1 hypothetical protein [Morganella morganii]